MKTTKHARLRGFTLVELLVVIVIIAALAGLSAPMILRQQKAAARTEAINNARQVGLALVEFDQEFGTFPDATTAPLVTTRTGSQLPLGTASANDFFRQLIAYGIQSEDIFYSKTSYTLEPDNVIIGAQALGPGEVGFGYIMLQGQIGQSTSGNPGRPVLVTPLQSATAAFAFDIDAYGGKAVVLKLDSSVDAPLIRQTDQNVVLGNATIDQSGPQTVWNQDQPQLVPPLPRGGGGN